MHHLLSVVLSAVLAVHPGPALQPVLDAGAPAAMVLVRDGDRTRTAAVGVADLGTGRKAQPGDHFRAGSITKSFVAVVVLQLVAERRLTLDDRLGALLPGVLPYADTITVRQLLNHGAGVPDFLPAVVARYAAEPETWLRRWTPAELVALVADQPRGAGGHYSNTGFLLLGMVVEQVTGRSLASELQRRIIGPLRLTGTTLPGEALTPPRPAMHGYVPVPGGDPVDVTEWNPSAVWAAGALVSTLADLARFYRVLLTGGLLPRPLLEQMLTTTQVDGITYGLGIFALPTPCGTVWGHNGAVFGYMSDVFTLADGTRQVALVENSYDTRAWQAQEALIGTLLCR